MAESRIDDSKLTIVFRTSSEVSGPGEECEQESICRRTWQTWRSKRWWFACVAHTALLENLLFSNRSRQDIMHHFEEAANWLSDRKHQNALNMRLWLGELLKDQIQEFDEALALFNGVVQDVKTKLHQPATMNDEDACRFLESMYKTASKHMAHTYIELASRSYLVLNEYLKIAGESLLSALSSRRRMNESLPSELSSRKRKKERLLTYARFSFVSRNVLLRVKRSMGRLFMQCPDDTTTSYLMKGLMWAERSDLDDITATSTSEDNVGTIDDHHSPKPTDPERIRFHNDDAWAMNFLFKGDEFHGSKMLFIVYTMMTNDELGIWVVDGIDGTVHAFFRINLSHYIDEQILRFAEAEMETLKNMTLAEDKKSDIEHCAASLSAVLHALSAMNKSESGTEIYKHGILGMVAGLQIRAHSIRTPNLSTLERGFNDILGALYRLLSSL